MKNHKITIVSALLLLGILVAGALMIIRLSTDTITYQWDLKVYYHAALAADHGVDPYDKEAMAASFSTSDVMPFVYPPALLKVFRPLTWFEYETTYHIWLWLRLIAVGLLLWLWHRFFVPDCPLVWLLLFFVLAYDAAAVLDFKAGNIAVFEQLFLWAAFLAFIQHRTAVFCAIVVVLGLVKLSPIVFLALLLSPGVERRWYHLGLSMTAFGGGIAANYLLWPQLFGSYLSNVRAMRETGIDYNHALLPFLRDLNQLPLSGIPTLDDTVVVAIYCAGVIGLIAGTLLLVKNADKLTLWRDRRLTVILVCVLYVMLVPHMKAYTYLILIPPTLVLLREYVSCFLMLLLAILILLPIRNFLAPWEASGILAHYYPLLLGYLVWSVYMYALYNRAEAAPE